MNYVQLDYDSYPLKSNKFLILQKDIKNTKNLNPYYLHVNSNLVQSQKISEINGISFQLKQNKNNIFPAIKKSCTALKNNRDITKVKYNLSSKYNNGSFLISKDIQKKTFQRPKSSKRIHINNQNKFSHKKFYNQDYNSIVLNSININDNYDPLNTLNNRNLTKINFYSKK